jgi:hypothetical protein
MEVIIIDMACQLADDLYFKFMDNLSDDIVSEFVIDDKDNIGGTKNTEKGSDIILANRRYN